MYILIHGSNGQDGRCMQDILARERVPYIAVSRQNIAIYHFDHNELPQQPQILFDIDEVISSYPIKAVYYFSAVSQSSTQSDKLYSIFDHFDSNVIDFYGLVKKLYYLYDPVVFYFSSSLVFDTSEGTVLTASETSIVSTSSIYSTTKIIGHHICDYLLEEGVKIYNIICFNHESVYRSPTFLFPKIINYCLSTRSAKQSKPLNLGNPSTLLDVGYAPEYMSIIRMLHDKSIPGTYILSTYKCFSIKQYVSWIFEYFNINSQQVSFDTTFKSRSKRVSTGNNTKLNDKLGVVPNIYGKLLIQHLCRDYEAFPT